MIVIRREASCHFFDSCYESAATAESGLLEPQPRNIIGCKEGNKYISQMKLSLLTVLVCQVLNEVPEVVENGVV